MVPPRTRVVCAFLTHAAILMNASFPRAYDRKGHGSGWWREEFCENLRPSLSEHGYAVEDKGM